MEELNKHPLAGKKDIDSAFSGIWSFYKQWFVPLFAISFVMSLIVSLISSDIDISSLQGAVEISDIMETMKSLLGIYTLVLLISLFFNILIQYYIIKKPLDEDFSLIDAAGKVLIKYYLPMLIVFILLGIFATLALIAGALLFIIGILFALPYVILFFSMAVPVMIIENTSIGDTISRLFKLVHNRFWPNMGWISIYIVLVFFFSFIVNAIIMLPFTGSIFSSMLNPEAASEVMVITKNPFFILLSSLTSALTVPLLPILGLILYYNNSEDSGLERISGSDSGKGEDKVTVDDLTP